jgi:hypothetical protein
MILKGFGGSQSVSVVLHWEIISQCRFWPCFTGLYNKREAFLTSNPSLQLLFQVLFAGHMTLHASALNLSL